jgi:hypothetical protein
MKCISSPALGDAQIISFIEGEADAAVTIHMVECQFCAQRAERWLNLQNNLKAKLYRRSCPTPMELGDYHLGLLSKPRDSVVEQHMRRCPLCRREVNELEAYLKELVPQPGVRESVRVLIARLIGGQTGEESSGVPAVALRGERNGPITYEADGLVIIVDIQANSTGQASILGQVAADDQDKWTDSMVELRQADAPPKTAAVDDLGSFHFEEVLIGSTELTITSPHEIIVQIPKFDLVV